MNHVLTLPGDWDHPGLLLSLLEVVEARFRWTDEGLADMYTGLVVGLAFSGPVDGIRRWFEGPPHPLQPPLTDDVLDAIEQHRSVAQIQVPHGDDPAYNLELAFCAANSIVDAGALAVHLLSSGRFFEADAFQAQMSALQDAPDTRFPLLDMAVRYALGPVSSTVGMAALGLPDVVLLTPTNEDRAVARLERTAHALLAGETFAVADDPRPAPARNPHGVVFLQDAEGAGRAKPSP